MRRIGIKKCVMKKKHIRDVYRKWRALTSSFRRRGECLPEWTLGADSDNSDAIETSAALPPPPRFGVFAACGKRFRARGSWSLARIGNESVCLTGWLFVAFSFSLFHSLFASLFFTRSFYFSLFFLYSYTLSCLSLSLYLFHTLSISLFFTLFLSSLHSFSFSFSLFFFLHFPHSPSLSLSPIFWQKKVSPARETAERGEGAGAGRGVERSNHN